VGITFKPLSNNWNEQTGAGCIIQNAELHGGVTIENASPKLDNCIISSISYPQTSPLISNNIISGDLTDNFRGGSPMILSNNITGSILDLGGGSPIISNNTISSPIFYDHFNRSSWNNYGVDIEQNINSSISNNSKG
jgi:hypothetical protein